MAKEEKVPDKFIVSEIRSVSGYCVQNIETNETYDINQAIVKIMNDLEIIKKAVA